MNKNIKLKKRVSIIYIDLKKILIIKLSQNSWKFSLKSFDYVTNKNNNLQIFVPLTKIRVFLSIIQNILISKISTVYFNHLKIYGLGFRISLLKEKKLRIDFGWSHVVFFNIPTNIFVLKKKTELLFYSNNKIELDNFIHLLTSFYQRSPYTLKGIFNIHQKINVKIGKQRQK